jgi:hypothetical protein
MIADAGDRRAVDAAHSSAELGGMCESLPYFSVKLPLLANCGVCLWSNLPIHYLSFDVITSLVSLEHGV